MEIRGFDWRYPGAAQHVLAAAGAAWKGGAVVVSARLDPVRAACVSGECSLTLTTLRAVVDSWRAELVEAFRGPFLSRLGAAWWPGL